MRIDDGGGSPAPDNAVPNLLQARQDLAAGKGTLADQATVMKGSAANLVAAAGTGFKLEPEAAVALIASCTETLKILEGLADDLYTVQYAPQLGGTQGAQTVSQFTHGVATDKQGIVQAVRSLQATVEQMRQAYIKAVGNYGAIEQQVTDAVNKLHQEVQQQNAPVHGKLGMIRWRNAPRPSRRFLRS